MSTSATVTLTLKSKPKIQPLQPVARPSSTAVKLKLTKPNGQAASANNSTTQTSPETARALPASNTAQTSSASTTTVTTNGTASTTTTAAASLTRSTGTPASPATPAERKSPPKNGTAGGTTPKVLRRLSMPSPILNAHRKKCDDDKEQEPIVPPPRAKVLSRFPLKRFSVDARIDASVRVGNRDKPSPLKSTVKKDESTAPTSGDSAIQSSQEQQQSEPQRQNQHEAQKQHQQQQQPQPPSPPAAVSEAETSTTRLYNGTASGGSSATCDAAPKSNNCSDDAKCVSETKTGCQEEKISEKDKENITLTGPPGKVVDDLTKRDKKTPILRRSVKKKSPPKVLLDRRNSSDEGAASTLPRRVSSNGSTDLEQSSPASSDNACPATTTDERPATQAPLLSSSISSSSALAPSASPSPSPSTVSVITSHSTSPDERVPDDIEESSTTSTLTPRPSEERELVTPSLSNGIASSATETLIAEEIVAVAETETAAASSTAAAAAGTPTPTTTTVTTTMTNITTTTTPIITTTTTTTSTTTTTTLSDVHINRNSTSTSSNCLSPDGNTSAESPLVKEEAGTAACSSPADAAGSECNTTTTFVQMPRSDQSMNAATSQQPAEPVVPATSISEIAATKPPKPEAACAATAKDGTASRKTKQTSSALGKTLQKPFNLAQKILEAALQKSPLTSGENHSAAQSQSAVLAATAAAAPSTSSGRVWAPQTHPACSSSSSAANCISSSSSSSSNGSSRCSTNMNSVAIVTTSNGGTTGPMASCSTGGGGRSLTAAERATPQQIASSTSSTSGCWSPQSPQPLPPSRPSSVMANVQTVDIRNLGRLLRSPTPRPLSVLDVVDPRESELKDAFADTASSSGVSCSLSTHSLATTIAQSRSASPESLLSLSAAPSRHGSKKMEHYGLPATQGQVDQQKLEAYERKQARFEADLKEAQYSLTHERAQMVQLQEELREVRQERNEAQQRLDAVIADAVRKEKLALRLQKQLTESGDHENTAEIEVGILKRQQSQLEDVVSTQKEDLEDLQSQLHLLKEQNKQLEDQIRKQADQSTRDIQLKDRELDQIKTAAHNEVAHYQQLLKECQEQRRELLRKNSELQEKRQELIEQVQEVGDQAATEKRLKRCLYRTLVLLRDARVTIEHMRATQPTRTHLSKLRQKAEEADQLKEIAERAKQSAVAQGEQLEQALEQVVQTRHFLQTRLEKVTHENKQLQDQVGELTVDNAELEERYKKQVSINSNEQESREEAANKIVKLEAQVETLESRLQQLRFERQVEEDSRVNAVLNSFETRTNQLELKLETEKLDKHKLETQYRRLSDQLENVRRELDAAQKREASLQITTTNQQRCLLDMRRELAEARDRNCQMRMERQTLDSQLEELIEEVRHLQTCLRVANQRIRDLEIALETTDPIQIESIMESIIEDSNSDDYEDAGTEPPGPS